LIIFKGENLSRQWIPASIHKNWRFGCNSKGWTSNEHGLQWLRSADRMKPPAPTIQESIIVRAIELTTPFKESALTSSPIYNEDTRLANAALLTELTTRNTLSTPARTYAHCVVRREERSAVRNIIGEEEHERLRAAVTKRKAMLSGKRQIVDGKHILTTPEVHGSLVEWEKTVKKRKTTGTKKSKRGTSEVEQECIDESEASQDKELTILDCIEVRK